MYTMCREIVSIRYRRKEQRLSQIRLQTRDAWCPSFSYPPHILLKSLAPDLDTTRPLQWRVLIGHEEWVLAQPYPRILHRAEHNLELRISQPSHGAKLTRIGGIDPPAAAIYHADEAHTCVSFEAIGGKAVVYGVEKAKVTGETDI